MGGDWEMTMPSVKRSILQRILGKPATKEPEEQGCWVLEDGKLIINLDATPELQTPGGAIRLEGGALPLRVLVVNGEDGKYRAYHNKCTHFGHRRLDPVPGTDIVQCCSINKSTFNSGGEKISGPAGHSIKRFSVEQDHNKLVVLIGEI